MTMDGVNVAAWDLSNPNPSVADAADQNDWTKALLCEYLQY